MDEASTSKKPRDAGISVIVDELLENEQARKRQKHAIKAEAPTADADDDEPAPSQANQQAENPVNEGPIKEHLLTDAYTKRQQAREERQGVVLPSKDKLNALESDGEEAGTGTPEKIDEIDEVEELDGEEVSRFDMREEEADGFNLETGEWRRKDGDEEELEKDPWLASLKVEQNAGAVEGDDGTLYRKTRHKQTTVTNDVKHKIEKREAAAADVAPLTDAELTAAKKVLLAEMNPRETVMQAMTRISAVARPQQAKARHRGLKPAKTAEEVARQQLIERFADAASALLSQEADIFDQRKEEIEHAVNMHDVMNLEAAQGRGTGDDDDEDMFADSDDEKLATTQRVEPVAAQGQASRPQADASLSMPAASHAEVPAASDAIPTQRSAAAFAESSTPASCSTAVDYDTWPISEMKRVLTEARVSTEGVTEKSELVRLLQELDKSREAATAVPDGFVLDPASGYYFQVETGWYFDLGSGAYYKQGQWYSRDPASGSFVAYSSA